MDNAVEFLNSFRLKIGLLSGIELSETDPFNKFEPVYIRNNEEIPLDKLVLYQIITDSVLYDVETNLEVAKEIANTYEGLSSEAINNICNGKTINEIGLPIEVKHYIKMYEDRQYFKNNPDVNLIEKYLNSLEDKTILNSEEFISFKEGMLESIKEQLYNFKRADRLQLFNDKFRTLFYFFKYYNIPAEELIERLEQDLLKLEDS